MQQSNGFTTFLLLLVALVGFGAVLWLNSGTTQPLALILPTEEQPTAYPDVIGQLLDADFGDDSTPLPTVAIPQLQPTRPVIAQPVGASPTPVQASDRTVGQQVAAAPIIASPTLPPATAAVRVSNPTLAPDQWNPPPLIPPYSVDPLGRDHFFFRRPIESNANNAVLYFYSYGADGQNDARRIHHGIDLPNPVGEEVYAAGSGIVRFASDGRQGSINVFQNSQAYGNVVFIEHDFGWQGRRLYTLYTHLQAALVTEGEYVEMGQPIALVGQTGDVTGPHVHFEVRLADVGSASEPRYGDTYNPSLWMVPYVGHGVVAGRVINSQGEFVDDVTITLRNVATGLLHPATTTTYTFADNVNDVNPDPIWRENFALTDVPVGRYDVIVTINNQRVVGRVNVLEGTTAWVELRPPDAPPPTSETGNP